jgi:hypothetical protein
MRCREDAKMTDDDEPKIHDVRPITRAEYINLLSEHAEAGNALVAAGLVEDALERLLLHAARPLSNTLAAKIFDGLGPLSQFAAKNRRCIHFSPIRRSDLPGASPAVRPILPRLTHSCRNARPAPADFTDLVTFDSGSAPC